MNHKSAGLGIPWFNSLIQVSGSML